MEPPDYKVNSPMYGTDDRSMEKQRSVGIVKVGVIIAEKSVARLWCKQKQLVGPSGSYVLINTFHTDFVFTIYTFYPKVYNICPGRNI